MKLSNEKIYYSYLGIQEKNRTKETFINPDFYKWTPIIEENHQIIYDEIIKHFEIHKNNYNPYFADDLVNSIGKWKSFGFYFFGIRAEKKICDSFSTTIKLLKQIPGIVSASVSIMEPNSEIKPHYGDTNAIHRCHLGLLIPAKLPLTGFQVGFEKRSWEQGKLLIFNDAAYHKAWNESSQPRMVLIFDVIRPEFIKKKLWICAHVNAILKSQRAAKKLPCLKTIIKIKSFQWLISLLVYIYFSVFKRNKLWL